MAEPTLALRLTDLQGEVGFYLGYGRGTPFGDPAWTLDQQNLINVAVGSGLRRFFYPTPPYSWSFLRPISIVAVAAGVQAVQLPDDFGGLEGVISIQSVSTQLTWVLQQVAESIIRQNFQNTPNVSGRPIYVALSPIRGTTPTGGTRQQLLIYPITDNAYNLQVPYSINPDMLNQALPYPYGGAQHAETVRAAVLAAAEETGDNTADLWQARFAERLVASMEADRKNKPQLLGINRDLSDESGRWTRADWHGWGQVLVNGQFPGPSPGT